MKKFFALALAVSLLTLSSCAPFAPDFLDVYVPFEGDEVGGNDVTVSGNIDVALKYNGVEPKEGEMLFDDNIMWEPGMIQTALVEIENAGTLDFKYKLVLNCEHPLADILCVAVVDENTTREQLQSVFSDPEQYVRVSEFSREGNVLVGEAARFPVAICFRGEDAYAIDQGSVRGCVIDAMVVATQVAEEDDSFGPAYDADASYN